MCVCVCVCTHACVHMDAHVHVYYVRADDARACVYSYSWLHLSYRVKVMFAWWGAEEWGLVGSRHFVNTLSAGEKANISLNLNMDMLVRTD